MVFKVNFASLKTKNKKNSILRDFELNFACVYSLFEMLSSLTKNEVCVLLMFVLVRACSWTLMAVLRRSKHGGRD